MLKSDIQRAQRLSKQIASLGLTRTPTVAKKTQRIRSALQYSYEIPRSTSSSNDMSPSVDAVRSILEPMVKQYFAENKIPEPEVTQEFVKEIVKAMHSLPEVDKLEVSKGIRNSSSFIYGGTKYGTHEMMHGGASSSAMATDIFGEVVAGSGTSWTLAHIPSSGTLRLYANGQRLTLTVDYTIVGTAITTLTSWVTGTVLADYQYV